jgi:hypothetical protein
MDDASEEAKPQETPIDLCVVCGHLAFARYPVLVGHYTGDTFAGSELRLDQALNGRLSERRRMGLYPGPIGSSTVVLDSNASPPGAVVVGLGEPASLSIGALRRALRHGILAFAAARVDQCRSSPAAADGVALLRLSPLLIGAGEGGLDQISCVHALLQALKEAQAILSKIKLPVRVAAIDIMELYADRSYATLRAVKRAVLSDPALESSFKPELEIKPAQYSRRSAPVEADPSWWQPIQITMSSEGRRERSLSFTIGGGFARSEARTIAANLDLVAPLVRRVSRTRTNDATPSSPGRALFELLWPASLKDQSADERNRRLILDERSASFPWELLDDRRPWTQDDEAVDSSDAPVEAPVPEAETGATRLKPPAVRAGMIRQLLQTRFREEIVTPRGKPKALVIGNPGGGMIAGLPSLTAAEREADTIAGLLKATHDVTQFGKDAKPDEIYRTLFTDAWEIIHISAHGMLRQPFAGSDGVKRAATGIVLGPGVVLGPSALAKLPVSPGIVFVNCCYLGSMDIAAGEEEEDEDARQSRLSGRPEFAANVAVELIKLGARCVIAAGWAVDDKAAALFGETFYREMLDRETFGTATRSARQKAYMDFAGSNTWGAFQCYGDPDYRLRPVGSGSRHQIDPSAFVAIPEAIDAVQQVRDDLNIGVERNFGRLNARLKAIEDDARNNRPQKWLASAELRVALAEAWAELGDLAKAIEHYAAAVGSPDTSFKVRAIEQLANLSVRNAVVTMRPLPPETRDPAKTAEEVRTWLRKIEGLTELLGETRERLALQGGCWKRIAQVQPPSGDAANALERMAACYDRAAHLAAERDKPYPLLMACSARICDAVRAGKDCDGGVAEQLKTLIDAAPPDDADFWELIQRADTRMADTILRSSNPSDEQQILLAAYQRAWRHVGSPVKLNSVIEQIEFYEDIFSSGAPETERKRESIMSLARELRNTLKTEFLSEQP